MTTAANDNKTMLGQEMDALVNSRVLYHWLLDLTAFLERMGRR